MPSAQPVHILISRTDNIGDVVLTLPLAGYLKSLFPGARIDFLCRAYAAPVVRHCRFVDQVIALEALVDPEQFFAQAGYDTVIFAFPKRDLARAAKRAGVRNRVGTSHRLFNWFYCNKLAHFGRARSTLHEAQLNFELLRPLGISYRPTLAQCAPLFGLSAPAPAALPFQPHEFNLILHTKSNGNGREWPLAHFEQLAQRLQAWPEVRVWLTGSAAEGQLLAEQGAGLLALPNVRNLCGTLDLDGLTGLIGAADGLVASGTGPLHLSAALGRPTLGLFPALKPMDAGRWGTLGLRASTLSAPGQCAGCRDARTCTCMGEIGVAEVAAVVLGWRQDWQHQAQLQTALALAGDTD